MDSIYFPLNFADIQYAYNLYYWYKNISESAGVFTLILMQLLAVFLVLSSLILLTSGWGDVIHYPEYIKHMGEIGKYENDLDQKDPDDRLDADRALIYSSIELRRALCAASIWRMLRWSLRKRSFSTSQLRRR